MNEFIKILLSLSLSGTLVLLLILFLKQFYKNKSSRCWQYYILLVAALRFVIPFTPELTVTGYLFENASTKAVVYYNAVTGNLQGSNVTAVSNGRDTGGKIDVNIRAAENNENTRKNKNTKTNKNTGTDKNTEADVSVDKSNVIGSISDNAGFSRYFNKAGYILVIIWLAVVLALLVNKITTYRNFIRYVTSGNDGVSDIATLELLAGICEAMKVKGIIELYKSPLVSSPVMTGFLRPCIIIPEGQIAEKYLIYIFKHELYHYKHRDMLYKWFVQIIICLHWFNPFVYLLGKEINKACELSCDEAVISSLDEKSKRLYGDTLVLFAGKGNFYKNNVASVMLTEGAKQLKERLGNIMDNKRSKKKRVIAAILTAVLTVIICTGFIVSGAYSGLPGKETVQAVQKNKTDGNDNTSTFPEVQDAKSQKEALYVKQDNYNKDKETSGKVAGIGISGIYTGYKNDNGFIYIRQKFYSKPYLIETGWNLRKKQIKFYSCKKNIQVNNNKEITVYFEDDIKKYAGNKEVSDALSELFKYLDNSEDYPDVTAPLVLSVVKIPEKDIPVYLEKEYINKNPGVFSVLYQYLDKKTQDKYLERSYKEKNIEIFSVIADYMDNETIKKYLYKSINDNRIEIFSEIIDYATEEDIDSCAEKCYKKGIRFFSEIADYLDDETIKKYLYKSINDNKIEIFSEIIDYATEKDIDSCAEKCYKKDIKFFSELALYMDKEAIRKYLDKSIEDNRIEYFMEIVDYATGKEIDSCAEKCYKKGIRFFSEIADCLDGETIKKYLDKSINDNKVEYFIEIIDYAVQEDINRCAEKCYGEKIKFFSEILDYLDYGTVIKYLDKSIDDKNIKFFTIIMEYISKAEDINRCAWKCYKNGFAAGFAELANFYLSDAELAEWEEKAEKDKKDKFYDIIYSILY